MAMQKLAARFIMSVVQPGQFPPEELPEFAFLGRSNVGKSRLLNSLVEEKGLARVSQTPGRTQAINFFRVGERYQFVDLPGYGYAKVPRETTRSWKTLIDSYLEVRQCLALCFLLLDARRGWMDMDLELREWLAHRGRPCLVIGTKWDKLKTHKERHSGLARLREHAGEFEPVPFSAVTGLGVREIWQTISKITPTHRT
jgi:GTP-binding protein